MTLKTQKRTVLTVRFFCCLCRYFMKPSRASA